ncbi:unnamed protein product [Meganyctiphanes norvegica]|uniref:Uncharacterized protein n=1 Tax=Meganyctiphanes norvegica TaxID=48144 RepID=A0AAV2PL81_MEGNR
MKETFLLLQKIILIVREKWKIHIIKVGAPIQQALKMILRTKIIMHITVNMLGMKRIKMKDRNLPISPIIQEVTTLEMKRHQMNIIFLVPAIIYKTTTPVESWKLILKIFPQANLLINFVVLLLSM